MIKINDKKLETITFPNGETGYKKDVFRSLDNREVVTIDYKFEGNASLMDLMFAIYNIRSLPYGGGYIDLKIGYLPYSRMDRDNDSFICTLKLLGSMLKKIERLSVTVIEPHSDATGFNLGDIQGEYKEVFVTPGLVTSLMMDKGLNIKDTVLVYPDAGAAKRYPEIVGEMAMNPLSKMRTLTIAKVRDFATGNIKSIEIAEGQNTSGLPKNAIIIDDLSSRGGTFLGAAAALKEAGIKFIYLVVAHAEEAILEGGIPNSDLITEVYTTDTIISNNKGKWKIKIFSL